MLEEEHYSQASFIIEAANYARKVETLISDNFLRKGARQFQIVTVNLSIQI